MKIKKLLALSAVCVAMSVVAMPASAGYCKSGCKSQCNMRVSSCNVMKSNCQMRAGHWWNTTWVGPSMQCALGR